MVAKVTINFGNRKIGLTRLLWNKLTPTRNAFPISNILADYARAENIVISVRQNGFIFEGETILGSKYQARALLKAGVNKIEIAQGMSAQAIRKLFNNLTDKTAGRAEKALRKSGIAVKKEGIPFTSRALYWALYKKTNTPLAWIGDAAGSMFESLAKPLAAIGLFAGAFAGVELESHLQVPKENQGCYLIGGIPVGALAGYFGSRLAGLISNRVLNIPDYLASFLVAARRYDKTFPLLKSIQQNPENHSIVEIRDTLDRIGYPLKDKLLHSLPSKVRTKVDPPPSRPAKSSKETPPPDDYDPGNGATPPNKTGLGPGIMR